MMGHFGGSNYAFKPSACVTYSPSPWGGMRCATALRPFLSELGCLPVSKLCGLGSVQSLLNADGTPAGDEPARMLGQLPAMLGQLEWMACAMADQRAKTGAPSTVAVVSALSLPATALVFTLPGLGGSPTGSCSWGSPWCSPATCCTNFRWHGVGPEGETTQVK